MVEHDVLERIDDGRLVSVATALVQAGGENPPGGEQATVDVLTGTARDLGLDVTQSQVEPGRDNVRITLSGGDDPGLLLLGHTDVVPVGDGWTKDPFGGVVEEGRIYGRGTADMKGGLAAAITAMAALRGVELAGPVELAALVDEEETGKGIRAYVDAIRGGPGQRGFAGCIVAEPTDLQTIIGARGDCYVRVVVGGRACHAGNPGDGANAIYGAAAVVAEFERMHAELARRPHPLFGPASFSVGEIQGGNGAAVVPASCIVVADRRLLPGESPESVQATVSARLGALGLADRGLNIEVTVPMAMPPFETDREDRLVRHTDTALRRAGGPGLPLAGWSAACDGGFIARDLGVPVVVLGPGSVTTQAHRPDESVAIEQLVVAARAYALTVLGMLG